jgi:hypothetical protein
VRISAILPWWRGDPALQLDVEMAHLERAFARFAHRRVRLRQQCVQRFAVGHAFAKVPGSRLQRGVVERLELPLQCIDLFNQAPVLLEQPVVPATEYRSEELGQHAAWKVGEVIRARCGAPGLEASRQPAPGRAPTLAITR